MTEFGGRWGQGAIIVLSHVLLGVFVGFQRPTVYHTAAYFSFLITHCLLAALLPGGEVTDRHGYIYRINAFAGWAIWLTGCFLSQLIWPDLATWVYHEKSGLMTVAVLTADLMSLGLCGGEWQSLFLGRHRHPKIATLDLTMLSEIRFSWILMFLLTCCNVRQTYEQLPARSMIILFAHLLYTNACQKGEECIPSTWDFTTEKYGWLLCFWNLAGVPFLYSEWTSGALAHYQDTLVDFSAPVYVAVISTLALAYQVWDMANSQKNYYRMGRGPRYPKWRWPVFEAGYIAHPLILQDDTVPHHPLHTPPTLLVDGFYAFCKKPHYTADVVMAWVWAIACGAIYPFSPSSVLIPFSYPIFFTAMIIHRAQRDQARCKKKYEDLWDRYDRIVPNTWLPSWGRVSGEDKEERR